MKVAFLSSEVTPFAKTGGLADVAGALPKALAKLGADVRVFMPLYRQVKAKSLPLRPLVNEVRLDFGGRPLPFSAWEHRANGWSAVFIEHDPFFDREGLYGTPAGDYPDNGERFCFFARASLETLRASGFHPDVIHGHDWQAAAAFAYLRSVEALRDAFARTGSLFTIHNLAYQGLFDRDLLGRVGLPESLFNMNDLEFYGRVNLLKAGILYASAVTTVSPRYSREIQTPEFGCGLDGLLRSRASVLHGILNGADYQDWDPTTDRLLPARFGPHDLTGKRACRKELLGLFGLDADASGPVAGMVTRLAGQKGLDILCQALDDLIGLGLTLVILGTGEQAIQDFLTEARRRHPSRLGLKIAFDERIAHLITAGSDMFLIPSRYEPCGLTQMYALKYGTIPVVRATGGLDDTIEEFDAVQARGNGFKFAEADPTALTKAALRALEAYGRPAVWSTLIQNAMAADFSWDRSAAAYLELYRALAAGSPSPRR